MKLNQFIGKIKNYSLISFLLPLITINICLFTFKILGSIDLYPNFNWNEKKIEKSLSEYYSIVNNQESLTFMNCPKYKYRLYYITIDGKRLVGESFWDIEETNDTLALIVSLRAVIASLSKENKIKSVLQERETFKNDRCVKNYKFTYLLLSNFSVLEKILINTKKNYRYGFGKVKNPYLYGEVSISRTARYFPANLIFKPLIILSAIFLLLYWRNNLNLFKELENKNILSKFSKKFFYLGALSCIFLILHASFLGLDFDSKLFSIIRKLIIVLFIVFEICAQFFLTRNLLKFKGELIEYINPLILKIKITFVAIIFFATSAIFALLIWGNASSSFKHVLEWNYFSILLVYYLLSRLLWKS